MPKGVPNKRYTPEFKKLVVETMQQEKLSYRETARQFEISDHRRLQDWEQIYLTEGPEGFAITQPHVNTLYKNKYPWVVTIAKKEYSNLFSQQVFVAIDFKFSSIAKYIDKVSIGQRGYCYIVNSKGQIIYHPQQQMLFSGLKEENTFEISELSDGIHRKKDNIYNISSLDSCNWKIVGVSFNDEITQAVKSQVVVGLIFALLFSAFMSAVIYFLLSRTVTRPVRRLVASMQKFEKQAETFEYKADMSNVAEFQTLSTSFEHMVLMIQSLVEKVHNEEIVLRKTELKALQAQINPHYLYNIASIVNGIFPLCRILLLCMSQRTAKERNEK